MFHYDGSIGDSSVGVRPLRFGAYSRPARPTPGKLFFVGRDVAHTDAADFIGTPTGNVRRQTWVGSGFLDVRGEKGVGILGLEERRARSGRRCGLPTMGADFNEIAKTTRSVF
jgi:hypothetical protein